MPDKHANLPASAAYRWMPCPGSIAISKKCPPEKPSAYAAEGTLAHTVAETKLRIRNGEKKKEAWDELLKKIQDDERWGPEMDEATDFYADAVMETLAAAGEDAELMIEQEFGLTNWVPEGFGTSDAVVIGSGTIYVIDLKYGTGVKVEAKENPQLRLYALGASELFSGLYDFDKVMTMIVQPRRDHISGEELTLEELRKWGEEVVAPAAKKAASGTEETHSGDWCKFCPAAAVCRTRAEDALSIAKDDFKKPAVLSDEEIGEILQRADEVKAWIKAVEEYALDQAKAGTKFTGWKLVEGKSTRKYKDELEVAKALKKAGFKEAMIYEKKLLGITAMTKLVGKAEFEKILKDLIIKPPGKPTLAPESDKREAIDPAKSAKEDFSDDE